MPFPPDGGDRSSYPAGMKALWFPSATARAAIAACERSARTLTTDLEQRPGWAGGARDSWEGPYRRQFDTTFDAKYQGIHDLKERITALGRTIGGATANVAAENRLRAGRRIEYDRQQAEAARRAEATASGPGR